MRSRGRTRRPKHARSTSVIDIVKRPADLRHYRVVILPNGITAMLISEHPDGAHPNAEMTEESADDEAAAALCVGIGSFSDPPEVQGFAHFMEHMVFMGSQKFPKENHFDDFLAKNGGDTNAWTDCERTCFFFVINEDAFLCALDVFAQFFIGPSFNKGSVDREIMAVDNECQMSASKDSERERSVISYELVELGHPMKKFMAGNKKSLKEMPEQNKIDVYGKLRDFYDRMYTAHYMSLVIHSSDSLDNIENNVMKIFSKVPNNEIPRPKYLKPPFQDQKFNKILKIVPMEDVYKLEIVWALPSLIEHYRARTIEFLSVLLGHEGKGSILSYLKKKHFALEIVGGNDMSGYHHNSTWSSFSVHLKLTELGFRNYLKVIETVYQYIDILRKEIPTHTFEEQKHIQETKYIFKDTEPPYSYVELIAENMHLYPPEHYLCGKCLFFEYNEQLMQECLDFLRPERMLVILFSKNLQNVCLNQEPWIGTKYTVCDFGEDYLTQLKHLEPNPSLYVPEPNPYISTDFSLIKTRKNTKFPVVVMETNSVRMWYKKDSLFKVPTAHLFMNFTSVNMLQSTTNVVIADIYLKIMLQNLTETLYNATLAGYEYTVEGVAEGMVFIIWGYNEKMELVARDTLSVIKNIKVDEDTFFHVVDNLKQDYINELIKPVEFARALRYTLLEDRDPSLLERYAELQNISYNMLVTFQEEFYSSLYVEAFLAGNVKPQDAIEIGELIREVTGDRLSQLEMPKKPSCFELPEGQYKLFMPAINKDDTNSCVIQYYQQGPGTFFNQSCNELLQSIMSEPLFRELRTQKMLGYSVYCSHSINHGILGFSIIVESQANRFSMKNVDQMITNFVEDFGQELTHMSKDVIQDAAYGQSGQYAADDATLFDECSRFWQEIVSQSYIFDRSKLQAAAMEKITPETIFEWYKTLCSPNKKKLSIMIEGCNSEVCNMVQSSTASDKRVKNIVREINCATKVPGSKDGKSMLPSDNGEEGEFIANICQFRSTMNALPHHIIKS